MLKPMIYIQSSRDSGVDWNEDIHEKYCQEVTNEIYLKYPSYWIEVVPADVMRTKVGVSNPGVSAQVEDEIAEECERICQDVWEQGDFWD